MPSLRLLPDLEESIRQIPGVRAASVVTDAQAQPREVHVLAAPGKPAKQIVRDVVEHAAQVLPATLVALEGKDPREALAGAPAVDLEPAATDLAGPLSPATEPAAAAPDTEASPAPVEEESPEPPAPLVDLTARRLLVAGLRPIDDPPFP